MSYFELSVEVECPHCEYLVDECAEFNMAAANGLRITSGLYRGFCTNCNKDFWFKAECCLETDCIFTSKKKPKDKKI